MINDLDAGAGRFDQGTQYTVNTQLVNGTLMNIADKPTDVQLPGSYDSTPLHRVPIIVTGNDLSTLYAPLIRDGRMDKFYWEPDREDKIGIVGGIFEQDGLSRGDLEQLVDTFINQAVDFFGALRSRLYDEQIRQFIHQVGFERVSSRVVNSADKPPEFKKPDFRLSRLIEYGNIMVQEQQRVQNSRLVEEYNTGRRSPSQVNGDAPNTTYIPQENRKSVVRNELANEAPESNFSNQGKASGSGNGQVKNTQLSPEVLQQVQDILSGGYRIALEYADERRFRTNGWKSCASIPTNQKSEAVAAIESCLAEHSGEYVRLIGIDPKVKRRVVEKIVQRPKS
ncbi:MAG: ribulose bisphosphate carboxylase small subunit [Aphanothece sp. CMT-3BRIN-NPC111]|jgi:ribulose bisphosphate carboxylase small subunit|nr:ribulose bisphosphate carboxylase small subunit [Aphanothece sp. CMT-3BRIN-NPC111]